MAGVNVPASQKRNDTGQALQIGGAVVGGVYGGPGGAMMGANAGQMVGGMAANGPSGQPQAVASNSAMQRRAELGQPPPPSDYAQLDKAVAAAQTLPPDQQQQYLPVLEQARMRARGGVA